MDTEYQDTPNNFARKSVEKVPSNSDHTKLHASHGFESDQELPEYSDQETPEYSNQETPEYSMDALNKVNLCVGYSFTSWEEVDMIIETYGKQQGFGIIKKRLEQHNDEVCKKQFDGILVSNPSTMPKTVSTVLRHSAQKKLVYGEIWGLARQATQLAIEQNNHHEILVWLREFIQRQKEMVTTVTKKRNQEPEDKNEDSDSYSNNSDKENKLSQVENLLVSRCKGRSKTKRYKSSTEKKQKPHAKYTCRTCGQSGHNTARCQNR
ncbi:9348_t:CDS:2 [Dentiscutata erythropus]|uniref:9348_t:CDS:1 n=1 Tax=Dentiscutata erythropus TaxID=1348616 RepID=A0A9N9DSZ4_9GLOM|nr:9348_t:CDS:2 [Dentiscutata erythropus]